ncbi:transposase [Bacillus cereus B4264]|uniref:Transposase n=1 Tax=Bacillus cereus (strain B4264) TaxID=405532 RepID=B7HAM1_BACC4|nr:transposase [Bacillus cereus B4264]
MTYGICFHKLSAMKKVFILQKEVDSIAIQSSICNIADANTLFFKK